MLGYISSRPSNTQNPRDQGAPMLSTTQHIPHNRTYLFDPSKPEGKKLQVVSASTVHPPVAAANCCSCTLPPPRSTANRGCQSSPTVWSPPLLVCPCTATFDCNHDLPIITLTLWGSCRCRCALPPPRYHYRWVLHLHAPLQIFSLTLRSRRHHICHRHRCQRPSASPLSTASTAGSS
jgi:hypothetical protein